MDVFGSSVVDLKIFPFYFGFGCARSRNSELDIKCALRICCFQRWPHLGANFLALLLIASLFYTFVWTINELEHSNPIINLRKYYFVIITLRLITRVKRRVQLSGFL